MTLYLMTNWDHPSPEEVDNDEDADTFWTGMDLWSDVIRSINAQSVCNCCDLPVTSGDVAAMVVKTLDGDLMAIRLVCRRCGSTQERARLLATTLMPEMGGEA
jgi:hypothetical protein